MNESEFWEFFHNHARGNRSEIESSDLCGCIFCLQIYSPQEVIEKDEWVPEEAIENGKWVPKEETAICPRCGIDEVIGSASGYPITDESLERLHEFSSPDFPISWIRERYGKEYGAEPQ